MPTVGDKTHFRQGLPSQTQALSAYLDALLHDAPATPEMPRASEAVPKHAPQPLCEQESFQVQLFHVAGLTLALPCPQPQQLVSSAALMPSAQEPEWVLGKLATGERVIDTGFWLLPPERHSQPTPCTQILCIQDQPWALACEGLGEVITLSPTDIHWRTAKTQRRWLAGTLINQPVALIDGQVLARMLSVAL